ncbi:cell adhesion molecule CEACAM8-like [Phoenicopterus ruber ruber]
MGHRAPGPQRSPRSTVVLAAALLLCCPPPSRAQATRFAIRQDPEAARAGGDVTFTLEPVPSGARTCAWYRAPTNNVTLEIFIYFPGSGQQNGPAYTGRETGDADCSMRISRLCLNDTSAYTAVVRDPAVATASINLIVHVPLTQPAVTPDNVTVTENDTITLTCRSPPGTQTVAWLHDGAPVSPGGRLSLSPDNRTLTVRPAERGDAGVYVCQVSNAISTNRSDNATVTVIYGPDSVAITPPGPLRQRLGSRLELRCAADAAPPPLFAWARGNVSLAAGSRLHLDFGDPSQAGEYRCRATNPALGRAAEAAVLLLQDEGLSSGAIAGIILGTLLGLGLLGAAGYLLWRHVGRRPCPPELTAPPSPQPSSGLPPPPGAGPPRPPPGPDITQERGDVTFMPEPG